MRVCVCVCVRATWNEIRADLDTHTHTVTVDCKGSLTSSVGDPVVELAELSGTIMNARPDLSRTRCCVVSNVDSMVCHLP
jgi:hypothetical protein